MAFKLLQVAKGHWRRLDAAELVPLVRAGVAFEDGVQIEPQKKRTKAGRLISLNPQLCYENEGRHATFGPIVTS
jgi:hypothetical protein